MEVLSDSLRKIDQTGFTSFQSKIYNFLIKELEEHINIEMVKDYSIDNDPYFDVIIHFREMNFNLNFSLTKELLYINSNYFDIYVYPEVNWSTIKELITGILTGQFTVRLGFRKGTKLISREIHFDNYNLKRYNLKNRYGLFSRKADSEQVIDGASLLKPKGL